MSKRGLSLNAISSFNISDSNQHFITFTFNVPRYLRDSSVEFLNILATDLLKDMLSFPFADTGTVFWGDDKLKTIQKNIIVNVAAPTHGQTIEHVYIDEAQLTTKELLT